ncbi:MAG: GntR family transcriptional regulator, partial [Chitinivibrionales bacterium]|nr:GntR family transcriptional regulator [Chitinivibrionales bacterium]
IYTAITRDIRRGRYAVNAALPLTKELAERYGTGRGTIRRVLERLADDGWVRCERRRWSVTRGSFGAFPHNQIVLLGTPLEVGLVQNIPWECRELIRLLDLECSRRDIRLRLRGLGDLATLSDTGTLRMLENSLGCIIWLSGELRGMTWPETIRRAMRVQERVTIWAYRGDLPHPGQVVPHFPATTFYSFAQSEDDGRDVAMHVLRRGHTRAVFIGEEPLPEWASTRYRGICRAFEQCGLGRGCRLVECPSTVGPRYRRASGTVRATVLDELNALTDTVCGGQLTPTKYTEMNAVFEARQYLHEAVRARLSEPVFEQLYDRSDATVWICANDVTAQLAMAFFDRKSCPAARRPSLISFDDTPLAQHAEMSSYNFDLPALAAEMVDGIVRSRPRSELGLMLRVPGFVNDRGSVASLT